MEQEEDCKDGDALQKTTEYLPGETTQVLSKETLTKKVASD